MFRHCQQKIESNALTQAIPTWDELILILIYKEEKNKTATCSDRFFKYCLECKALLMLSTNIGAVFPKPSRV